jgi:hypothetical protein
MIFDSEAVGEISDSELSDNVAASGGTTSRAGAVSMWSSSSLTMVRCTVWQNMALLGGEVSEGGGICVQQSSLVLADSTLRGNSASGGASVSRGGLISLMAPSFANITGCTLADNHAALGGMQSLGGAVYAGAGASKLQLASSSVLRNVASSIGIAAGGAIYTAETVVIRIADSELRRNQADGGQAEGGAVWSAAESLHATNVTFSSNVAVAHGTDASALGGALFQQVLSAASTVFLEGCSITDNLARVAGSALRASGGALHCATGAIARLIGCLLQRNAAGGSGKLRSQPWWYVAAIAEQLESAAMHIYSSGSVLMDRCRMIENAHLTGVEHPMWYWIVAQGGRLKLHDSVFATSASHFHDPCSFLSDGKCDANTESCPQDSDWDDCGSTPPPDAGPFGKLLNVRSPEAELVVRGSEVTNLTLKSVSLVGAVNSTFDPPLQPAQAVQPASGSGTCAAVLAGERLCDPRALCKGLTNGGVRCSCVGAGLRYKPSEPEDGRQCQQDASMRAVLESESVSIDVAKPGSLTNRTLTLIVEARGEAALNVTFNVTFTRQAAGSEFVTAASGSVCVNQPSLSAFGQHVEWKQRPPTATWLTDLDGGRLKYADTSRHEFTVRLACARGEKTCAVDGDVITTVVQLVVVGSLSSSLNSEVRVVTRVQSLLSCRHTRAAVHIEPNAETVPIAALIRVHLFANDVDDLPISFTRAEISLIFGAHTIPMQWSRGSNDYFAAVPVELTAQSGRYDLLVLANNAWNETGPVASCELLRRTIIVRDGLNTQWILVGAAAAAVVVIGGLVILVRKRGAHLQAIMVMLLTEAGQLVFSMFTALANLLTDGIVFGQLLRGELKASTEAYTAAYAALLCFAVVATAVSMAYQISNGRLVQTHVRQLAYQSHVVAAYEAHREVQQHEWELAQTHRTKVTLLLSLLGVVVQGAPASAKLVHASAKLTGRRALQICLPLQICPCPS